MSPDKILDLVRAVVGFALDHVPHDEVAKVLTEEAVKRQNAIADAAETAKFGAIDE